MKNLSNDRHSPLNGPFLSSLPGFSPYAGYFIGIFNKVHYVFSQLIHITGLVDQAIYPVLYSVYHSHGPVGA
jgi:hypothetical protein